MIKSKEEMKVAQLKILKNEAEIRNYLKNNGLVDKTSVSYGYFQFGNEDRCLMVKTFRFPRF